MPIYEFVCGKCGKESEVLVRSSKWQGTPCPNCGSKKLSKKLSTFAASVAGPALPCGSACPTGGVPTPSCGCACGGGKGHRH